MSAHGPLGATDGGATGVAAADQLVLSHFSLARHHDIADRVASAAAAGFDAIGLYIGDFARLRAADRLGELDELLAAHRMPLTDIEVLRGWGTEDPGDERSSQLEADAWEMADRYGCRYVQAIGPVVDDLADAARRFGALCDRAADHGLVVGLEYLPFTNVRDADTARAIVEAADRPNGGLCVDIWHQTRGSNDVAQLRRLQGHQVVGIQMSDGPLVPRIPDDYVDDCLRTRVPPGEGEMDAVGFVVELLRIGVSVPWQLEVCNDAAWDTSGLDHVRASAAGMRRVLAEAHRQVAVSEPGT
jgi:sugar phosphate isomerase/epimerase